jgi:hypothetical protein
MTKKTLREREQELQAKMLTAEGRAELDDLVKMYALAGAGEPGKSSRVTYILVYERVTGRIRL